MTHKQLSSDFRSSTGRLFAALGVLALLLALTGVLGPARIAQAAGPFSVDTTNDTHDAAPGNGVCADGGGACSLRAAVEEATALVGANTINLPPGTYDLSLGELQAGSSAMTDITLAGTGTAADTVINQTDNVSRVFNIDFQFHGSVTVSISHVTIQNGRGGAGGGGGGILDGDVGDVLNLTDVVFNGNNATSFNGGAISFTGGGTLNVQSSTFTNNTSLSGNGGAIHFLQTQAGSFSVAGSTFTGNTAAGGALGGQGGAINVGCNICSPFSITNSIFTGNTATQNGSSGGQGGAVMAGAGTLDLNFNRIVGNTAAGGGSGVYDGGGTVDASNNWWGCNGGPGSAGCDTAGNTGGALTTDPRIVLSLTAIPPAILVNQSSNLTASFLQNSDGQVLTAGDVSALVGDPVAWSTNATFGTLAGQQLAIQAGGTATATFNSNGASGFSSTSATVNNQLVTLTLNVNEPPAITSADNATFTVGTPGTFTVTTTGFPTPFLSETGDLPTGVTFVNNGNGTATLAGTPAPGTSGAYPITITAANGIGSDATQAFTLTVNQAPAITSASSAAFSVGALDSFTVTTTGRPTPALSETGALPTGVGFVDNGDGTATLSGTAAAGTGGSYPITITAANGVAPDATQLFTLTVNQPPAITSADNTTFPVGASGSFTVTATGFPAPALSEIGALPGGVGFTDNGNGTAAVSGTPAPGSGGTYPITITANNGVTPNATQVFTLTVSTANTTTALISAPNPSVFGQSVTFTATVNPPVSGTPTGTVTFFDGAASLGAAALSGGTTTLTTSVLAVGTHSVTAVYGGDGDFNGSTSSPVSQDVNQVDTTTALVSAPNPSVFGQSVTLTATVSAVAPGAGAPSGTVTFFDGAASLGTSTVNGSDGTATLTTAVLAVETHSVTAVYGGDTSFNTSTSSPVSQVVNQVDTTTALVSAPNPSIFGQSVTLTATVSAVAPGAGAPSGTVTFFDGAASLGAAPLSGGSATLTTAALSASSHSLTAVYNGDASFAGSTSGPLAQTVNAADTTVTLAFATSISNFALPVTFTATVAPVAPGGGTPTGSVTFLDGATPLATVPLANGVAALTTATIARGAHSITAEYTPDNGNYTASSLTQSELVPFRVLMVLIFK